MRGLIYFSSRSEELNFIVLGLRHLKKKKEKKTREFTQVLLTTKKKKKKKPERRKICVSAFLSARSCRTRTQNVPASSSSAAMWFYSARWLIIDSLMTSHMKTKKKKKRRAREGFETKTKSIRKQLQTPCVNLLRVFQQYQ